MRTLILLMAAVLLMSCQPPGPPTARLRVSGPNVFLNGERAEDGAFVGQGARVSTGSGSSAIVDFNEGTILQLDENSDPGLRWEGDILVVDVGYGWFLIDTGRMRVRVVNELAETEFESRGVINVVPQSRFDAYLFQGRMAVLRPPGEPLRAGEKVSIRPGQLLVYGEISPAERTNIEARFQRWRFPVTAPSNIKDGDSAEPGGANQNNNTDEPGGANQNNNNDNTNDQPERPI